MHWWSGCFDAAGGGGAQTRQFIVQGRPADLLGTRINPLTQRLIGLWQFGKPLLECAKIQKCSAHQ